MSFLLNFDICSKSQCRLFTFTETTNNISVLSTGWNAPNPDVVDATAATLEIFLPANTTIVPSFIIDLFATGNYPTDSTVVEYNITNTYLGYTGRLPDGRYKFVYKVIINNGVVPAVTYKQTKEKFLACNAKCCVDKLFAAIEDFECDCMDEAKEKAFSAYTLHQSMIHASNCGQSTTFNKLRLLLERLCNNQNCCN